MRNNAQMSRATLLSLRGLSLALRVIHLVSRLRRVTRMCSRTVSGTAYRFRHGSTLCSSTVEKILCRSPISQRSHVGNLRQTIQGKGVIHKRVETAGVYPLVRPRGVSAVPFASQAKSHRKRNLKKIRNFEKNTCAIHPV